MYRPGDIEELERIRLEKRFKDKTLQQLLLESSERLARRLEWRVGKLESVRAKLEVLC